MRRVISLLAVLALTVSSFSQNAGRDLTLRREFWNDYTNSWFQKDPIVVRGALTIGDDACKNISQYFDPNELDYNGLAFSGWYTEAWLNGTAQMVYDASGNCRELVGYEFDPTTNGVHEVYKSYSPARFNDNGQYVYTPNGSVDGLTLYPGFGKASDYESITFNEFDDNSNEFYNNHHATYTFKGTTYSFGNTLVYKQINHQKAYVNRTLKKDKWNTVCFPFTITKEQKELIFSEVKLFTSVECDGDNASMKFSDVDDEMVAGIPYFVKLKSTSCTDQSQSAYVEAETGTTVKTLVFKNVYPIKEPHYVQCSDADGHYVKLIGNFDVVSPVPEGDNYLLNDQFYVSGEVYGGEKVTGHVQGFRCYFEQGTLTSSVKERNTQDIEIDLPGYSGYTGREVFGVDGIERVNKEVKNDNTIYDVCGRKLSEIPANGLYIINGKKYLAK